MVHIKKIFKNNNNDNNTHGEESRTVGKMIENHGPIWNAGRHPWYPRAPEYLTPFP